MGLKGGLHLLFNNDDHVIIKSLHFDGHEHHSGRHIDVDRIVNRMDGIRDYCSFDEKSSDP